jgi:hypothetical protein
VKQRLLFLPVKREKTISSQRNDFDKRNLETARIILSDPEQHGGPDAFPTIWARLVVQRLGGVG